MDILRKDIEFYRLKWTKESGEVLYATGAHADGVSKFDKQGKFYTIPATLKQSATLLTKHQNIPPESFTVECLVLARNDEMPIKDFRRKR